MFARRAAPAGSGPQPQDLVQHCLLPGAGSCHSAHSICDPDACLQTRKFVRACCRDVPTTGLQHHLSQICHCACRLQWATPSVLTMRSHACVPSAPGRWTTAPLSMCCWTPTDQMLMALGDGASWRHLPDICLSSSQKRKANLRTIRHVHLPGSCGRMSLQASDASLTSGMQVRKVASSGLQG